MIPIVLLGEAWGEQEAKIGRAFVGPPGVELLRMLDQAEVISLTPSDIDYIRQYWRIRDPRLIDAVWQLHPEVERLNVFNLHPPDNNMAALCGTPKLLGYPKHEKGFIHASYQPHLDRLATDLNTLNPNLVVGLGNTPLWALLGTSGISKLRGTTHLSTHTVADFKVLCVYHPAAILRQWELRPITVADLSKTKIECTFPEVRRPQREIWIEPTLADIRRFVDEHVIGCRLLSEDIETSGDQITCVGFAPNEHLALVIPFYDARRNGHSYWPDARTERFVWNIVREVNEERSIPKLFQNGLYDIAFLYRSMGIKVYGAIHDTMLLHHALQPEMLKSLEFLGSAYTSEGPWKKEHRQHGTIKRDA